LSNDSFETEFMEEKWQKEFEAVEEGFDKFREFFDKNRSCKCESVDECKHFESR